MLTRVHQFRELAAIQRKNVPLAQIGLLGHEVRPFGSIRLSF